MRVYLGCFSITILAALTGCVIPQQTKPIVAIQAKFDLNDAQRLLAEGGNNVKGSAFLRQRGGGVVTCAGANVALVPATAYANERITRMYLGRSVLRTSPPIFDPDPPEYLTTIKTTKCDAQGNFVFERVADGEFFINTAVVWQIGTNVQGGSLIQRLILKDGKGANIVMTEQ